MTDNEKIELYMATKGALVIKASGLTVLTQESYLTMQEENSRIEDENYILTLQ